MSTVVVESQNNMTHILLKRPDRYNALNKEMLEELLAALEFVEKNDDLVLVISGEGKAFSAGGDMAMLKEFSDKALYEHVMQTIEQIVLKLYMLPKIVISAIHGSAAGLGFSLALNADYVIAEKQAKVGMLFMGVGLAPDGGGHFFLQERVGTHKAKQFIWGMERVSADNALSMGLVDIVTERAAVEKAAEIAESILSSPFTAMLKTKMIYHRKKAAELKHYLHEERKTQWELRNTKDHKEGVSAFLEKRKPVFTGE